jgi:hypothetical protein
MQVLAGFGACLKLQNLRNFGRMSGALPILALRQWRDFLAGCVCRICHQALGYECADGERKYFVDPRPSRSGYVHGDCLAAKLLRLRYPRATLNAGPSR